MIHLPFRNGHTNTITGKHDTKSIKDLLYINALILVLFLIFINFVFSVKCRASEFGHHTSGRLSTLSSHIQVIETTIVQNLRSPL